ncbi:DUF6481 family protein [Azospirillum halopraeferens]|uniref:DUF6481 family protein n=1 Tax=Azospirillum halopraeferens TaxID=34010 RepID=UPI001FDF0CC1|nr:DUF6481 family protein [Azospirillum halopraeferens]
MSAVISTKRIEMNSFKNTDFADRLRASANAKKAMVEKIRAQPGVNDPAFAEREAARQAIRIARDARAAERKAALAAQQAAAEAERASREASEALEAAEQTAREVALEAERKASRDARYAARKARKR